MQINGNENSLTIEEVDEIFRMFSKRETLILPFFDAYKITLDNVNETLTILGKDEQGNYHAKTYAIC